MSKNLIVSDEFVKNKIHTIRGKQVILDRDISQLYEINTRHLKQAVKRNKNRFPSNFMFELKEIEINMLVSQNVIPSKKYFGGASPYVFTEQGVAMLSSILKSQKAIEISIKIMNAFISMRDFLKKNINFSERLDTFERKQIEYQIITDKNFEKIFDALQIQEPKQGIFFDGQIFDAYLFISKLIRKAKKEIILLDNYVDNEILEIFIKTKVKIKIYTKNAFDLDIKKVQKQYSNIKIEYFDKSHDRFLIIDDEVYLIGASLKDLGKKWFAFSKIDKDSLYLIDKLKKIKIK